MRTCYLALIVFVCITGCKSSSKVTVYPEPLQNDKEDVELIVQLKNDVNMNALCGAYKEVGLKPKKLLSERMGTWLMSVKADNEEEVKMIMEKMKMNVGVVNVQINHKKIEQRDN